MATQRNVRKRNAAVPHPSQMTPPEGGRNADQQPQCAPMREDNSTMNSEANGQQQPELDEYMLKRLRNNAAVSRTRQKKRMEQVHTSQRVKELREENAQLERTLDTMRRELALLKEMVVVCAAKGDDTRSRS